MTEQYSLCARLTTFRRGFTEARLFLLSRPLRAVPRNAGTSFHRAATRRVRRARTILPAAICALALLADTSGAQGGQGTPAAPSADAGAAPVARVDALFAGFSAETPGCAVAVSKDDKEILARGYGSADLEHGALNTAETVFEAGSVSKQFTAAAILLLAQAGKLELDDPVRDYVPELPDYGSPEITLRHLLHHTSGLRDWGTLAYAAGWPRGSRVHTHAHVLDIVSRQKSLNFPPGREYLYCNTGYNLLAIIVERLSGKTFAQYTRDTIFVPLGMTHTEWRDDYTRIVKGRAIAYEKAADGYHLLMPFENVHGNGGLLTTVGDLLRWNRNFTSERVGGRALITELQRRGRLADGLQISYARGLSVSMYRGLPEVSHSGSTAGYRAFLTRFPTQALSVAVLCNAANAPAATLAHDVAKVFLGNAMGPEAVPSPLSVDASVLARWAGLYRSVLTGEASRVSVEEGALRAATRKLVPQSGSLFTNEDGTLRFQFRGEGAGRSFDLIGPDGDVEHHAVAASYKPTPADLARYEGTYVSDEAEVTYTVKAENGVLVARRRPDARFPLAPTYKDAFTHAQLPLVLFRRDPKTGQVVGLSLGLGRVRDLRFRRLAAEDEKAPAAPSATRPAR
jgi:CubicO group peptidase (beta-lactamase class C family)